MALAAYERVDALEPEPEQADTTRRIAELRARGVTPVHSSPSRPKVAAGGPPISQRPAKPGPAGWAYALTPEEQYEWLVDCYRLRIDDDYVWNGEFRGLYEEHSNETRNPATVRKDFFILCWLAVKAKVVPQHWDWTRFLQAASGLLPYAFEKSDAQEKYGSENKFAGPMGVQGLRSMAELVYGRAFMEPGPDPEDENEEGDEEEAEGETTTEKGMLGYALRYRGWHQLLNHVERAVAQMGGKNVWQTHLKPDLNV